jgi:hypothetical protein
MKGVFRYGYLTIFIIEGNGDVNKAKIPVCQIRKYETVEKQSKILPNVNDTWFN